LIISKEALDLVDILDQARHQFKLIASRQGLLDDSVCVTTGPLSPRQAIGTPVRQDYPLLTGREVIVEAKFRSSYGQAFTSNPHVYEGSLSEILALPLTNPGNRAVLLAAMNAVSSYLGLVTRVRHCKDDEPEKCAVEISSDLMKRFGRQKIGMIGYQPAILERLTEKFGAANIVCTDLNPANIGEVRYGVEIWDGTSQTLRLIDWGDLVLVTSSTLSNGTLDAIYEEAVLIKKKKLVIFGITGASVAALLGLDRLCFYGH
jgi:uncharacterized protein (DUF4213/DUF364 family)